MPLFKEINSENKLRLTLSPYASENLATDADIFGMGAATVINRIIREYYADADCSVSVRLEEYRRELVGILGKDDPAIPKLISAKERKLTQAVPKYGAPLGPLVFRLSNENVALLTEDATFHEEKYFAKGMKQFVQSLVEEFARLPFVTRERYYFNHIAEALRQAVEHGNAVWLTHDNGNRMLVRVYAIMTDPLSFYNYLIAANVDKPGESEPRRTYSYRLSRIQSVTENRLVDGSFNEDEIEWIKSEIKTKGVQFMSAGSRFIKVYLTDRGIRNYNRILHMRPQYVRIQSDGHTYVFDCTPRQIEFYFMRFGADARVKAPKYLADRFAEFYRKASAKYEK